MYCIKSRVKAGLARNNAILHGCDNMTFFSYWNALWIIRTSKDKSCLLMDNMINNFCCSICPAKLRPKSCKTAAKKEINWPTYLNVQVVKPIRHLRSNVAPRLYVPLVQGTFQHSAAIIFNEKLAANIRNCKDFKEYCRLCKAFSKAHALSSL